MIIIWKVLFPLDIYKKMATGNVLVDAKKCISDDFNYNKMEEEMRIEQMRLDGMPVNNTHVDGMTMVGIHMDGIMQEDDDGSSGSDGGHDECTGGLAATISTPKRKKKSSRQRLLDLDRRLKNVEKSMEMLMAMEARPVCDGRGISKKNFLETIRESIASNEYPCGVSKIFIKRKLTEQFQIDFSNAHYAKKLNSVLKLGIEKQMFFYDGNDGLYKLVN